MARCISDYDKKIKIESLTGTADAHGHVDNTAATNWTTYTTAYASSITKGGREFWKVSQVDATVDQVWFCQYDKTLAAATPKMRLIWEDVTYEIMSVIDIDLDKSEIEIQTRRAV